MAAKIGLARLIMAAKLVQGNQFWQSFMPKSVQPNQFKGHIHGDRFWCERPLTIVL